MSAVLIVAHFQLVNVIPVKVDVTNRGIVKTIAKRFCIEFKWVTSSTVV